jgi:hypothetical protein
MINLFDQIDGAGVLVKSRIRLKPYMTLPDGHQWVPAQEYVPSPSERALAQIAELELLITPRRLREALLTGDHSYIDGIEAQIAALREVVD